MRIGFRSLAVSNASLVAYACATLLGVHALAGPTRAVGKETNDAVLTVGVIPIGKVWIDNIPYGYAPVKNVRLKAGRHVIGAGDTRQRVRRTLRLAPKEQRAIVLDLTVGDASVLD